jgi:thymidylate synthase
MLTTPQVYTRLDDVQWDVLSLLVNNGRPTSPRGIKTLESPAVSFALANPRNRCVCNPVRRWSFPLALGELCWHLSGSDAADGISYYAPIWSALADIDGRIRGSCYGSKIFDTSGGVSLWQLTRQLLQIDNDTRRAVIYFNDTVSHLDTNCLDAACATSFQLLIRDGQLDAIVNMRSNDAIWGLPYDVFLFTFLQEMMAVELKVALGTYYHFAGSLHLYERHLGLARRVLGAPRTGFEEVAMPMIDELSDFRRFLAFEKGLRLGTPRPQLAEFSPYWGELAEILYLFQVSKNASWTEALDTCITSNRYLRLLMPLAKLESIVL